MAYSNRMQKNHVYSEFLCPRGRDRIYDLGMQIAQMYLSPFDRLIGFIGEASSGKSALVKGMFPGLELTNDDDGVNVRPLPLLEQDEEHGFFTPHSYHIDIRFEMAFTPLPELAMAIMKAFYNERRVIIEHFDLVYPYLPMNAHLLIGIGEEIMIARPTIFGPEPQSIADQVFASLSYRLMAHTAEDICEMYMSDMELSKAQHGDTHHGFVMIFDKPPEINFDEMEDYTNEVILKDVPVSYADDSHITIGGIRHRCRGPRTHVSHTAEIEGFCLLKEFIYDAFNNRYLLVGFVGEDSAKRLSDIKAKLHKNI